MGEQLSPEEGQPARFGKLDVPKIRRGIEELREGVREASADLAEARVFLEEDQQYLDAMLESEALAIDLESSFGPSPEVLKKAMEDVRRMEERIAQIENLQQTLEELIKEFQRVHQSMEASLSSLPEKES